MITGNVTIRDNIATIKGGGVYFDNGTYNNSASNLIGNQTGNDGYGGGLYALSATLTFENLRKAFV